MGRKQGTQAYKRPRAEANFAAYVTLVVVVWRSTSSSQASSQTLLLRHQALSQSSSTSSSSSIFFSSFILHDRQRNAQNPNRETQSSGFKVSERRQPSGRLERATCCLDKSARSMRSAKLNPYQNKKLRRDPEERDPEAYFRPSGALPRPPMHTPEANPCAYFKALSHACVRHSISGALPQGLDEQRPTLNVQLERPTTLGLGWTYEERRLG